MPKIRTLEILLVDDNYFDIRLVQEFFKDDDMIPHNLHIVEDGIKALDFLRKQNEYQDVPTIDIVLLDINLPKKDGKEVLKEIREDINLTGIPVIVLNSIENESFVQEIYALQADFCVSKPIDTEKFLLAFESFKHYFIDSQ